MHIHYISSIGCAVDGTPFFCTFHGSVARLVQLELWRSHQIPGYMVRGSGPWPLAPSPGSYRFQVFPANFESFQWIPVPVISRHFKTFQDISRDFKTVQDISRDFKTFQDSRDQTTHRNLLFVEASNTSHWSLHTASHGPTASCAMESQRVPDGFRHLPRVPLGWAISV